MTTISRKGRIPWAIRNTGWKRSSRAKIDRIPKPVLPLTDDERAWATRQIRRRSATRFSISELLGTTTLVAILLGMVQLAPLWLAGLILGLFTIAASLVIARSGLSSRVGWLALLTGLVAYAGDSQGPRSGGINVKFPAYQSQAIEIGGQGESRTRLSSP